VTAVPAISVVLVADTFETIRRTVEHLRGQSLADGLQLVIATLSQEELALDAEACGGFHSVRVVIVDSLDVLTAPRAAAMRAADAPIVLVGETHSFPEPTALEAVVERHDEPWAVVGMVIRNGNPASAISWANVLMDYGSQLEGMPGGEVPRIASHNGAYKRDALDALGDALERFVGAGDVLNDELVARGGRLYLETRARTSHFNVSRYGSWWRERIGAGRAFAGYRARDWSVPKRAAYACGSPLIPVVRLLRIRGFVRQTRLTRRDRLRVYPTLTAGLCLSAFGELVGYVAGIGSGERTVSAMELHRRPHLRDADLPTFDGA
jgi:hypothetical protein